MPFKYDYVTDEDQLSEIESRLKGLEREHLARTVDLELEQAKPEPNVDQLGQFHALIGDLEAKIKALRVDRDGFKKNVKEPAQA
jgi:hypothetical protein